MKTRIKEFSCYLRRILHQHAHGNRIQPIPCGNILLVKPRFLHTTEISTIGLPVFSQTPMLRRQSQLLENQADGKLRWPPLSPRSNNGDCILIPRFHCKTLPLGLQMIHCSQQPIELSYKRGLLTLLDVQCLNSDPPPPIKSVRGG